MTQAVANPSDAQQQIERDFPWNFLVNTVDGTFFSFGISFFSSKIILPLFVSHYTSSPLVIGLITAAIFEHGQLRNAPSETPSD